MTKKLKKNCVTNLMDSAEVTSGGYLGGLTRTRNRQRKECQENLYMTRKSTKKGVGDVPGSHGKIK